MNVMSFPSWLSSISTKSSSSVKTICVGVGVTVGVVVGVPVGVTVGVGVTTTITSCFDTLFMYPSSETATRSNNISE